ncbi:hypothetical protein JMJ35_007647 [Cladonia borealis]|uniref:Uncharacterized protein n=1 Tax=Cladonia borealis TaxID=184061 RepID=A0AA39UZR7_9LECA|nr:hypothetical protein JMJ35_007647 [Cladonia borealis]
MSSSAPTRRNGHNNTTPSTKPPPPTSTQSSPSPTASPLTALLPTPSEIALLLTYPLLLLLGSLYSTLSPQTRSSPYNPVTQSHPPSTAPSYFALKKNLPNTYFVKIAWFWVTTSYAIFLLTHPSHVMGMSWWMLLMTATFFHTWFEKLTGLLVAMAGIFVVYFLPRALPAMRDIVGMPGV